MYGFTVMVTKRIIATSPGPVNVPCEGNTPWDPWDDTLMSSPKISMRVTRETSFSIVPSRTQSTVIVCFYDLYRVCPVNVYNMSFQTYYKYSFDIYALATLYIEVKINNLELSN
jgi:hypothetical protein